MPYDGQTGVAKDGTPVVWVASLNRAVPVSAAKSLGVAPRAKAAGGGPAGYDAAADGGDYQKKMGQARAAADIKKLTTAAEMANEGYTNEQSALAARQLVDRTPTGTFGGARLQAGKALGGVLGGWGVPTPEQTHDMEDLNVLGNLGAMMNKDLLKGPMSNQDVKFLQSLSYNINSSREHNQLVAETQHWVSKRQAAYEAAMRAWTKNLGSPSALNGNGMSFEQWWGGWSGQNLPRPGTTPPSPRAKANEALKAKSGKATGQPVLLGYE